MGVGGDIGEGWWGAVEEGERGVVEVAMVWTGSGRRRIWVKLGGNWGGKGEGESGVAVVGGGGKGAGDVRRSGEVVVGRCGGGEGEVRSRHGRITGEEAVREKILSRGFTALIPFVRIPIGSDELGLARTTI